VFRECLRLSLIEAVEAQDFGPVTDEGVAFGSDTAVGMMPIAHSHRRRASILAIVTRWQEVRPMNAVSVLRAPLQSTIARLS